MLDDMFRGRVGWRGKGGLRGGRKEEGDPSLIVALRGCDR